MVKGKRIGSYLSMLVMGGALVLSGMILSQSSLAQDAGKNTQTMEGTVSDAMCGATHHLPDAAKCTIGCTRKGSAFALVVGDKVYKLEGNTDGLHKLAGVKAKVTGQVSGDTIKVDKVEAAS
ncbi:MAG: hypothetical protein HYX72_11205 [Acidobacteria bacterium]|nr:hypothetical protein [Acidobacteriota bacterium]